SGGRNQGKTDYRPGDRAGSAHSPHKARQGREATVVIAAIQRELLSILPAKAVTAISRWFSIANYWTLQDLVWPWSAYQEFGFDSGLPSLVHASKCRMLV